MAVIAYIKTGITRGRVMLGIEHDGECRGYSVSEATYVAIGAPHRFSEISDRDLDSIIFEDEVYRAMKKAISILSVSDKSEYVLTGKLITAGFSRAAADTAVAECVGRGYVDESRQIERLVEREANLSLRGRFYIKRKLVSKGYKGADIDRAISALTERGDVDFDANLERLFAKKGAHDEESRRALLYKYGYRI